MMKLEKFAEDVLAAVENKAEGVFRAWLTTDIKNNGVKLTGIVATAEGSSIGPCVYLDEYYEDYENGEIGFPEAADEIYGRLLEHLNDLQDVSTSDFLKWETAKNHVYAKLINAGQNQGLLETVPHRMFLDLAVVYYMRLDIGKDGGSSSILIYNSHMEAWGQEEQGLYQKAAANMRLDGELSFQYMNTLLKELVPEGVRILDEILKMDSHMYVLTNRRRFFGAAELLDSATLKEIGEKLEDDFVVLPSSVHESIIVPLSRIPTYTELADMVREVNMMQVDIEERLSYHVYVYERKAGELRIAM